MTKDIVEDIPELVKNSEDEEDPSLEPQVNEKLPAAKKDEVSLLGPVEPPRPTMIRWAMGTGSAEMVEGQEHTNMWISFLQHPRRAYYRR